MLKIEDKIPAPGSRETKYPLLGMAVGQSIFVPAKYGDNVRRVAWWRSKQLGRKYVTRKVEGGIRVWRVA